MFLFSLSSKPENGPLHLCLPNHMPPRPMYIGDPVIGHVHTHWVEKLFKICLRKKSRFGMKWWHL